MTSGHARPAVSSLEPQGVPALNYDGLPAMFQQQLTDGAFARFHFGASDWLEAEGGQ
jgi:hypothetical protein